jgi:hypothetical protein
MINRTTETGNFFDHTATQKAVLIRSCQKQSLDFGGKSGVGVRHLQFHLKVRNCSQTPDQNAGIVHAGIGYGQPRKAIHLYLGQMAGGMADLLHALGNAEEG